MPDAAYYRKLARECFDKALSATNATDRIRWQQLAAIQAD
jgi:hypothetical protein